MGAPARIVRRTDSSFSRFSRGGVAIEGIVVKKPYESKG
jgi:hypothetical protein